MKSTQELTDFIVNFLDSKKAEDIKVIDLTNKSNMASAMIFASGRSTKNVSATADLLSLALKAEGIESLIEGLKTSEWVLLDAGDVIVHLFIPEARERYSLDKYWASK